MKLIDAVCKNRKKVTIDLSNNKFKEIIFSTPDVPRIKRIFEKIAYGLHYEHFNKKFHGKVQVFPTFLLGDDTNFNSFKDMIRDKTETELSETKEIGNNPDVFTYQFTNPDEHGLYALRMKFYGGVEVHTAFASETSKVEKDLTTLLIEGGIETNVHVSNKIYSFNKSKS